MAAVASILAAMGMGQALLVSAFLAGYALALGEFAGPRGRVLALATAALAAAGFVLMSEPWEAGVVVLALAPAGMALFAAAAWTLSQVTMGTTRPGLVPAPHTPQPALPSVAGSLVDRLRARLRVN